MLSSSRRYLWRLKINRYWRRYRRLLCDIALGVTICLVLSFLVVRTVQVVRPRHAPVQLGLDIEEPQTVEIIRILNGETRVN